MKNPLSEIERLKRKARRLYRQRAAIFDSYDCGHSLLMFISSRYAGVHTEFEKVMQQLSEIDPSCPPRSADR
jgi:hypothetical protein